jgi:hypothetical protein
MWVMWNLISVRFETVLVSVQDRCTVCIERTICSEIVVGHTRSTSSVALIMWNVISVYFELVLVSVQDRCTVYAKHITGLEIILDAPDGSRR